MGRIQNAYQARTARSASRLLGVLVMVVAGLTASTCSWYEHPGVYYCDETNNCADVPTTVCVTEENRCRCPTTGHIFCYKFQKCIPEAECFAEAGAPCQDASGGGGGAGGGSGGGGTGGG